jgi:hypothetical protein
VHVHRKSVYDCGDPLEHDDGGLVSAPHNEHVDPLRQGAERQGSFVSHSFPSHVPSTQAHEKAECSEERSSEQVAPFWHGLESQGLRLELFGASVGDDEGAVDATRRSTSAAEERRRCPTGRIVLVSFPRFLVLNGVPSPVTGSE